MSFTNNAYTHLKLAQNEHGRWTWLCESCGGDGERGKYAVTIEPDSPLSYLVEAFHAHVLGSHERTRQDFEGWPNGL